MEYQKTSYRKTNKSRNEERGVFVDDLFDFNYFNCTKYNVFLRQKQ